MLRYLPPIVLASLVVVPVPAADPADPANHWAFKAPVRPPVASVGNPIDAFILARLQKEGLKPSPEADRVALCRRLYLDLIGLPPTPKEVDEFAADSRPDAYERLVEKLLASPHHGERWTRHWLDAARYADSDGYEKDKSRQVWMYRDWVIAALNADMPYDRFIIEQIAGDLLGKDEGSRMKDEAEKKDAGSSFILLPSSFDPAVATGFLRMSMLNEEGGVDPEQFRMDAMFDRMDAVGKAVLGLSLACAQCHDHKFDPITQEDYYRVFAFLNNDHEGQRVVYTAAERMTIAALVRPMREIEEELRHKNADWKEQMAKWEEGVRGDQPAWQTLTLENEGDNGQRYIPQKDGSILAQGYAPTKFSTLLGGKSPLKTVTAFRLELLTDPNLPCGGPGRSFMGTCALSEFAVEIEEPKGGKRKPLKFVKATADYGNPERELEKNFDDKSKKKRVTGPVSYAIDGKDDTAWGIDAGPGRRNVPRVAVFVPEKPVELSDGAVLHFKLKQNHGGWNSDDHMNNNLGRFRLSVTDAAGEVAADSVPPRVRDILAIPAERRTPAQTDAVFAHWRTTVPEFAEANEKIEELWKRWPLGTTSLTVQARDEPRDTRLLKRGDFLKPTEKVDAGVPEFLHKLPTGAKLDRLTFAKWLVDRKSPTTARAFVNRVWQAYFGTGLVSTSEEFGTQGEKPSHPELLDWLAVEFMEPTVKTGVAAKPWSIKHLHRLIVTSATYRQSSRVSAELLAKDPNNRLLARGPRLRVEGEVVRDIALSASGLLNAKIGGASVFAPAPAFLFKPPASYGPFEWPEATGDERYRRGLYTFRRRSTPYPALTVFDAPIGEQSCVKRTRTNTPLQALTGLNETVFVECARALGKRAVLEGGATDAERVAFAFRLCVARKPTADELDVLVKLLEKPRARFAAGEVSAAEVATGEKQPKEKLPDGLAMDEWAAYTLVARVLLNLDETITKE
jgi:hypothetical protein